MGSVGLVGVCKEHSGKEVLFGERRGEREKKVMGPFSKVVCCGLERGEKGVHNVGRISHNA